MQVTIFRYQKGSDCTRGYVTYNANRRVQGMSSVTGQCLPSTALAWGGAGSAGDTTLAFGFVNDPKVSRVTIAMGSGRVDEAVVQGGIYYLTKIDLAQKVVSVVGYDAHGKRLYDITP